MGDLRNRMATGAAWMVLAKMVERSLGVVSTLILARLLMPTDFGIVAMAMTVVALLELVNSFGFDSAIIRDQNATEHHYNTAWTLNALLGTFIGITLVALAWPAAHFYNEPRLKAVMLVLAVGSCAQGFENVGVVAFRKELDFSREFLFFGGKKIAMFCATVPMAIILKDYWALVVGTLVGRLAGVVLSYRVHPYRPRFSFDRWRELMGFSRWLLLANFIGFLRQKYADLVLGRMVGPAGLGLFAMGSEIALLPSTELAMPINRAVFPAYAKVANDAGAIKREYLSVLGMVSFFGIPAALGIGAVAPLLTPTLLGQKWLAAGPIMGILAWVGAIQVLQSTILPLFLACSRPWMLSVTGGIHAAFLCGTLPFFALREGLQGVVKGTLISWCVVFPFAIIMVAKELELKASELVAVAWRPVLSSLAMYLVVAAFVPMPPISPSIVSLVAAILLGAGVYAIFVVLLWKISNKPHGPEAIIIGCFAAIIRQR